MPTTAHENRWKVFAILIFGVSLIVLDSTIVSVSLPAIITSLDLNLTEAQWVSSLYSVVFAALLLLMGTLGDKFGRTKIFAAGLFVFALASGVAAASTSAGLLIFARGLQGVGGAMILPSTLATINATFQDKERATAFGIWGAIMASMAAVGPLLGGWLTQSFSWHWIFLINIPIVLALLIAGFRLFRGFEDRGEVPGFDIPGTVLSALSLGFLVYGLIEATSLGWWTPKSDLNILGISPTPVAILLGLVFAGAFIALENARRRGSRPVLLNLSLFRIGTFSNGNITAMTVALGEFSALFVLPLYLISVLGLGTIHAGWVLATMALGSFLSGAAARHVAAAFGPALTVVIGLVLEIGGILAAGLIIGPDASPWIIAVVLAVYGTGVGLASAQLASVVLADVPVTSSGMGSATQSTSRQLGSALGVAVAGTVLATSLTSRLPSLLTGVGLPDQMAEGLTSATSDSAGAAIPSLTEKFDPAVGEVLRQAFADATSMVMYFSAGVLTIGLLFALGLLRAGKNQQPAH
ncbi:MFS transporter [Corynebacterium hindlerae]|uniref:MFS transporter n=1 Tax=Corynebacterium hindlerae TaxID=699041 RepID=UPI001AD6123C|nr:MFS transporter [Corynebacterium hindlerae]QTH59899.1 MFS transporter [Corynebacterium hindlerae]